MDRGDFYEDDEPVEDVIAAFEEGLAVGWVCRHVTITGSHLVGRPTTACGCELTPLYRVPAA